MNWFNLVNFILQLAPQELALVKAITDAAHAGHQNGAPLQPVAVTAPPPVDPVVTQLVAEVTPPPAPATTALPIVAVGTKPVLQK